MSKPNITVMTLFPRIIQNYVEFGIVKRARQRELFDIDIVNIRDAATDRHQTVDDTPYGGGAGMIMKPDVLKDSLMSTRPFREDRKPRVIYLTPQGETFTQNKAVELSLQPEFVLICGRYRDVDERFREKYVTDEISIGDYVISGGEAAALVVLDAVVRLIPGAMNDFESGLEDSFQDGMLDCPWYTRPETFEGMKVPDVLLSGDHAKIRSWRSRKSYERTRERRPDLLNNK